MNSSTFLCLMTVVGGFLSYFLADGCTYSAGILFTEFKDIFNVSSTVTSLVPALIYSIPQFMSPILCPITDVVGYSTAAAWGALFLCLSFIVTSFAQTIIVTYFAYGILLSLGLQLTYTAAFMAVMKIFKDKRWFGLACGVMVCGGGIGAFATNHFLSWILSMWTWREALILQGAVFLHAWISAALFYWCDEQTAVKIDPENYKARLEGEDIDAALRRAFAFSHTPWGDTSQCSVVMTQPDISRYRRAVYRLKGLWCLCPIFMILTPSRHRPRAREHEYSNSGPTGAPDAQLNEFCRQLRSSFSSLFSSAVWTNAPFLVYVLTNGLAAAGVVIPWTFVYDYVRTQWLAGLESTFDLSISAQTQLAWYPSLIGLGSCAGQILFGLLVSKVYNPSEQKKADKGDSLGGVTYVFGAVLLLNGVMTLSLTYAPVPSYLDSTGSGGEYTDVLVFFTTAGRVFAAICFLLGITDGAFMTLLGPMLQYHLDESNFAAGLGISLCITGAFNLAGTLIGGRILDGLGTHSSANLLAACLPLAAFLILIAFYLLLYCRKKNSVDFDMSIA